MNTLFSEELTQTGTRNPEPETRVVRIWCDGACSGNPGPGGWGTIVEIDGERHELSGGRARTTNNQMELLGLIEGLKFLPDGTNVEIVSDSEYVCKGVSSWMKGWIKNGWKNAAKQPVKNQELWQELNELLKTNAATNWRARLSVGSGSKQSAVGK